MSMAISNIPVLSHLEGLLLHNSQVLLFPVIEFSDKKLSSTTTMHLRVHVHNNYKLRRKPWNIYSILWSFNHSQHRWSFCQEWKKKCKLQILSWLHYHLNNVLLKRGQNYMYFKWNTVRYMCQPDAWDHAYTKVCFFWNSSFLLRGMNYFKWNTVRYMGIWHMGIRHMGIWQVSQSTFWGCSVFVDFSLLFCPLNDFSFQSGTSTCTQTLWHSYRTEKSWLHKEEKVLEREHLSNFNKPVAGSNSIKMHVSDWNSFWILKVLLGEHNIEMNNKSTLQ